MRILLLSAYDCLSHRYWRENLVAQFPDFDWTVLALPARHFNFRVRTNPVSWWLADADRLAQHYDLVIATSLVDIATLRGLYAKLAVVPLWLYCHENQFAYPASPHAEQASPAKQSLETQMVFFYGCLCADKITFNSAWNKNTALRGLDDLIQRFPEKWDRRLLVSIEQKSQVLPVPLANNAPAPSDAVPSKAVQSKAGSAQQPLQLVWNHRWEYDKGPQYLLAFARAVQSSQLHCTLHVVGQQFRRRPTAFDELEKLLDAGEGRSNLRKGAWGFIESRDRYRALLVSCDIVLSTALHDFQGISVLEAVQAGCRPLLPDQLVYPEQFATEYLYRWDADPQRNAGAMLASLLHWYSTGLPAQPSLAQFEWHALRDNYQQMISALAGQALR